MKSIRTTWIAAALLASLANLGMAATDPAQTPDNNRSARMEKMHSKMGERHAQHLAELKNKLNLEAGQEAAWLTFSQTMQRPALSVSKLDFKAMDNLTTPQRIDQMQAHKAQRDLQMQKHAEATKAFYAGLNPLQQKVFDAETLKSMKHFKGGRHASHRHEGH